MADNATMITDWLRQRRGQYFCHKCVSASTGVEPQAHMKTTCSECTRDLNCVGYFG